ncbi:MAG: triphosphoribosyl-dephospho-CoA synthase CitG [Lachnospiraceae bacterium]|nr:triphosphoribosyl-dephospho-CoA synthase CitG [Lachnospiraceae bacterium]
MIGHSLEYVKNVAHADERLFDLASHLGRLVTESLLEEVYTTPKPGLVDCYSNGSHRDMCLATFERSAAALEPYFVQMARTGSRMIGQEEEIFDRIREIGKEAEREMYRATGGVNTHKGLIFSMGILCTAAAICIRKRSVVTIKELIYFEQKMVRNRLIQELEQIEQREGHDSNGEKLYCKQGVLGVRGEALSGYSSVISYALPVMTEGMQKGRDYNLVKLQTLFTIMSRAEDSNILARQDEKTLEYVQELAGNFLKLGGAYQIDAIGKCKEMDAVFIRKNISPGGCADLLAITIFLREVLYEYGRKDLF